MKTKKQTGSYYTPEILSDFLILHILTKYIVKSSFNVLEPSCGDGQFINSFFKYIDLNKIEHVEVDVVEINSQELEKVQSINHIKVAFNKYHDDYLNHFLNTSKKYSLIIGNPPYVRKSNMLEEQISRCEEIHLKAKSYSSSITTSGKIKNIWPAFIEAAIMSLSEDGIICYVLPSEILQVKYSNELRNLIKTEFDRVEIFAFNELIFDGIEQDVIALIGIKKVDNIDDHGVSFYQVDALEDLKEPKFTEKYSNIHRSSLEKWTNYILSDEELNFIDEIKNRYHAAAAYCDKIEVGIVTAANDYFIINKKDTISNKLHEIEGLIKPILPKGIVVPSLLNFTSEDMNILYLENKKVNFISFPDQPKENLSETELKYLAKGEIIEPDKDNLANRYKMKLRKNWYHIPSVWKSDALFIKRCHGYPKLILNGAKVYATDSFYRVNINDKYSAYRFVFSFYNSLTFILAELEGRYYGGGVLELIPSEFKNLIIPYNSQITKHQFNVLDKMFRSNKEINYILDYTDGILLTNTNSNDINKLRALRNKLLSRRLKNHI